VCSTGDKNPGIFFKVVRQIRVKRRKLRRIAPLIQIITIETGAKILFLICIWGVLVGIVFDIEFGISVSVGKNVFGIGWEAGRRVRLRLLASQW
jgi:hypothetical protein